MQLLNRVTLFIENLFMPCFELNDISNKKGEQSMQIKEIFFIRCISCLSVVLIHAIAIQSMPNESSALVSLLMFSTPSFIFISEFLLAHSYPNGTPKGFLKKRVKFIFIPFVSMGVIDAFLMTITQNNAGGMLEFLKRMSANIFLGNYIGYFVLIIFQFYILHMLFHTFLSKASPKWVLPLSFFFTASYLYGIRFFHLPVSLPNPTFTLEWIPFFGWLFYFCLAYYCGKNYKTFIAYLHKFRYWIYIFAAFSAFMLLSYTYLGYFEVSSKRPDILLYTTSIVFLFFHLFSKIKNVPGFVMKISTYSFSIYLLHGYFLGIAHLTVVNLQETSWIFALIVTFVIGVAASIFASWIINQFKYGYMFVGKINKPKRKAAI